MEKYKKLLERIFEALCKTAVTIALIVGILILFGYLVSIFGQQNVIIILGAFVAIGTIFTIFFIAGGKNEV